MAQAGKIAAAMGLALTFSLAQNAPPVPPDPGAPRATFGVTVVDNTGLEGKIYLLKRDTQKLPNFKRMKPKGNIYATALNVPARHFLDGFPGITNRFEWFAIDYNGRFWIARPGSYRFSLLSDDGSKLYIDDRLLLNNDGIHWAKEVAGSIELAGGVHRIRVSYFQGPRDEVALVLSVGRPGERLRVFNTHDFRPANGEDWPQDVQRPK